MGDSWGVNSLVTRSLGRIGSSTRRISGRPGCLDFLATSDSHKIYLFSLVSSSQSNFNNSILFARHGSPFKVRTTASSARSNASLKITHYPLRLHSTRSMLPKTARQAALSGSLSLVFSTAVRATSSASSRLFASPASYCCLSIAARLHMRIGQ
jgi:hypothetical protein